ncbi:hypothetical protein KBK19_02975 [Microvirga sp. STR05]|uniref:DUF3808 domain-containing protein n=1 Tax=Hymenobacter duratus TaxID=2771356 RepID=A0ABR8JBC2_9BACT|nr:DUF5700 domain-containing putative Zn-dependent protease [Hymenobacter duratus]MBD2713991.1 hypothetical protein [Hymenobacter duratus]MBR7948893.1 hypothetical protein [Microvirga sp. STR05]
MKRLPALLVACLVLLLSTQSRPAAAQTVNIDAALRYWEMTDALRQDKPLTDELWQAFVAVPANQRYISSVFNDEMLQRYRRAIEVVYRPSLDSVLQAKLKKEVWYYVLVNGYKQREPEFKQYLLETARQPAYLDLMYRYAYEYLPRRAHTKVQNLQLAYVAIGNDAISEPAGLVFSLKSAIDWNKPKNGILEAHEMHHQLSPGLDFSLAAKRDQPLLQALSMVQNEGSADLIDKKVLLQSPTDSAAIREWLLAGAPAVLHKLDSVLQVAARPGSTLPELKYYRRLFNSTTGHLPGFYMARTLDNNGYTPQLLASIDNPLAFFQLYQKAAKKDKTHPPVFSRASLNYLKKLEKQYVAQARAAQTNTQASAR